LAIVDLDLHHGNGTQAAFYARNDVFYMSTHQAPFYPGSGWVDEIGTGAGEGLTANFPLPPYSGDLAFQTIMQELILPLLDRYRPEMILVSYGFDPHWSDPLGQLNLTASGYGKLIGDLVALTEKHCQGRIALILEGGYSLEAAQACSLAVTASLLHQPTPQLKGKAAGPAPHGEGIAWQSMVRYAKDLWQL
jgi:acetoin utilization deacetylase AcuC-like enzyme